MANNSRPIHQLAPEVAAPALAEKPESRPVTGRSVLNTNRLSASRPAKTMPIAVSHRPQRVVSASPPGAMLGGLLIGLIEVFWSGYFTVEYKDVAAFSILAIVLIFLPSGLLGKPEVEKV